MHRVHCGRVNSGELWCAGREIAKDLKTESLRDPPPDLLPVLASVLGAVDFGYRVMLATDAFCSSSDPTHDALLTLYRQRFSEQIETADTGTILADWEM
jgi:Isochorismatase family